MTTAPRIALSFDIYRDETIYSILARHCLFSGRVSMNETLKDLGLSTNAQLDSILPGIIPEVSLLTGMTKQELLNDHCPLNYFKFFAVRERYDKAELDLLHGQACTPYTLLSLVANRIPAQTALYFCPDCIAENLKTLGAPFWQRKHQLPGVSCCPVHHSLLISVIRCRKKIQLPHSYVHLSTCKPCSSKAILLSTMSHCLLMHKIIECADPRKLLLTYIYQLREIGFATESFHIRQAALRAEVLSFWKDIKSQKALAAIFSDIISFPFPQNMFYGRATHHPLKHLLLIGPIFGNLESFFSAYNTIDERSQPAISEAPIKVKSSFAGEVLTLLRQGMSLRKTADMVGCSVTFAKKIAITHQIPIKARPKMIFNTEIRAIWRLLFIGIKTQKIAKSFSISIAAVEHILAAHPYLVQIRKKIRFFNTCKVRRLHLLEFLKNNPSSTRNQVKQLLSRDYLWLFRYDKNWLYATLPERVTPPTRRTR